MELELKASIMPLPFLSLVVVNVLLWSEFIDFLLRSEFIDVVDEEDKAISLGFGGSQAREPQMEQKARINLI